MDLDLTINRHYLLNRKGRKEAQRARRAPLFHCMNEVLKVGVGSRSEWTSFFNH